ncbi:hypothetical protein ACFJIS_15660 [Variovorax boronicumulans]|uniref:hypothetical protein n=1 Tax=Variovorax boronicumulans TaxID=436515 RepID=UPI0036F3E712
MREGRLMIWFAIDMPIILLVGALLAVPALLTLLGKRKEKQDWQTAARSKHLTYEYS